MGWGNDTTLLTLVINDLRTVSASNNFFKYADDVTLISSEHSGLELAVEFSYIRQWALDNK